MGGRVDDVVLGDVHREGAEVGRSVAAQRHALRQAFEIEVADFETLARVGAATSEASVKMGIDELVLVGVVQQEPLQA